MKTNKPLRKDAQLSRDKILETANRLMQESGENISLEHVIQEANVGRTTFYRYFPNQEALFTALLEQFLDEFQSRAIELENSPDALTKLLNILVESMIKHVTLTEYWSIFERNHPTIILSTERVMHICERAITSAKQQGTCRQDFSSTDIILFCRMLTGSSVYLSRPQRKVMLERAAILLIEGIRI